MTKSHSNHTDQQSEWTLALSERFEKSWNGPNRFTIELIVREIAADRRIRALQTLIPLELRLRNLTAESTLCNEYVARLPDHVDTVKQVFEQLSAAQSLANRETIAPSSQRDSDNCQDLFTAGPIRIPQQMGRYRIVRKLGQGGMGSVFLAHDEQLDREVALKIPRADLQGDVEARTRFEREARAAAKLQHPNICPVHDSGVVENIHFICMSYIEGASLSEFAVTESGLTESRIAELIQKLARALAAAHEAGFIH